MIGIQANLGWKIESDRQSGSSVGEQVFVTLVRFFGVPHARILSHGPEAPAIHGWLHAASVRKIARITHLPVVVPALQVRRRVELANRNARRGFWISRQIAPLRFVRHYFLARALQ